MRCFLGLPLKPDTRDALFEAFHPLRQMCSGHGGTWVPKENLHLTLRFLGKCDRAKLNAVTKYVGPVVSSMKAPQLTLAEPGIFPPKRTRRMIIWAGVSGQIDLLGNLAKSLEQVAREAGFPPERRAFRPHITLARLHPMHSGVLADNPLPRLPAAPLEAREVHLFQSVRDAGGMHYPSLRSWAFSRPPSGPTLHT